MKRTCMKLSPVDTSLLLESTYGGNTQQRATLTNCPPSTRDFANLPNVVMSPHRGGAPSTVKAEEERYRHLQRLLADLQQQGWTCPTSHPNLYNIEAGY